MFCSNFTLLPERYCQARPRNEGGIPFWHRSRICGERHSRHGENHGAAGSKEAPGTRREPGPAPRLQAGPPLPPCTKGCIPASLGTGCPAAHPMTAPGIAQTYGTAWGPAAKDPAHPLLPSTALNTPARMAARAAPARGSCGWLPGAQRRLCGLQTAPNKPGSASKQDPAGSWKSKHWSQGGERVAPSPPRHGP